jgi:hypothetical protein
MEKERKTKVVTGVYIPQKELSIDFSKRPETAYQKVLA